MPTEDDLTNVFLDQVRIFVEAEDAEPAIPSMCTPIICGDGQFPQFSGRGAEECDDGNLTDGDGCSSTCTIEQPNFTCVDPIPPAEENNLITDGGFEGGLPSDAWIVSPIDGDFTLAPIICSQATCGFTLGDTNQAGRTSAWYAWFGAVSQPGFHFIQQATVIAPTATTLDFNLLVGACDSASDTLSIAVDGIQVYSQACTPSLSDQFSVYTTVSVDVSAFADGSSHTVTFIGDTQASNGGASNFFVDNIRLGDNQPFAGTPGVCSPLAEACTTPEQFSSGIPADWTVINVGPDANDGWGLSDDGLCA